jgi:hypothetical protein
MPIFLLSEQISHIFTTLLPATLRELASQGRLPVAAWHEGEPLFARDPKTIREILRAIHEYSC